MAWCIRIVTTGITTLLALAGATSSVADTKLGTEGNIYLANPYADPAESYYGFRMANGDFDGDGIDDLVISELSSPA
ncbi:MAG: hypothetical protein KDI80_17175, partial [Xanthomonadales bacterium]|nr:hypothetical protein [Xanthomonadales bacterium]